MGNLIAQKDAFQGHQHSLTLPRVWADDKSDNEGWANDIFTNGIATKVSDRIVSDNRNGIPRIASETRPINYTFNLWLRIA